MMLKEIKIIMKIELKNNKGVKIKNINEVKNNNESNKIKGKN